MTLLAKLALRLVNIYCVVSTEHQLRERDKLPRQDMLNGLSQSILTVVCVLWESGRCANLCFEVCFVCQLRCGSQSIAVELLQASWEGTFAENFWKI